ncbi:MAG: hypothetical protein OET08_09325, partial [Desulfuromonadales bacterium]|nr:hypothetical protein [Desulfuromonadales bacterium]
MKFSKWRIASLSVLCIFLAPFIVAEETLLAKVYRDYPGYIESPTCKKPEKAPDVVNQPAARNHSPEMVAAEESTAKRRAKKVYRDYPAFLETPTCINPRMAPSYIAQPDVKKNDAAEQLAAEQLAAEQLAAEQLAAEQLAAEQLAAEQL